MLQMSFLDELAAFLESVQAGEVKALRLSQATIAGHLRELEGWFQHGDQHEASNYFRWLHRCKRGLLERLHERVATYFPDSTRVARLVELALASLVEHDARSNARGSLPDTNAELGLVRARALHAVAEDVAAEFKSYEPLHAPSARRVAELLRLVRTGRDALTLTDAGGLLLRLGRRERLRWLLALELATSEGPRERSRMHIDLARRLLQVGKFTLDGHETVWFSALERSWEHEHREPLDRWTALGLLEHGEYDPFTGDLYVYKPGVLPPNETYELTASGRTLLKELLAEPPHPVRELARAMAADEDEALPDDLRWPSVEQRPTTRALTRYTKILTHEVRNVLGPVQFAARQLAQRLEGTELGQPTRGQIATMEAGLTRIFDFVDNWRQVMEQAEEPGAPFSVVAAVRDAIAASQHQLEQPVDLRIGPDVDRIEVFGRRELFTQVIVELIRNAVQVGGPRVRVAIEVEHEGARVMILICDDGPGIPVADRERIFQRGVTLRAGGTGQGLADVRDIVLDMSGDIRVEAGASGGARFVITLPSHSREAP